MSFNELPLFGGVPRDLVDEIHALVFDRPTGRYVSRTPGSPVQLSRDGETFIDVVLGSHRWLDYTVLQPLPLGSDAYNEAITIATLQSLRRGKWVEGAVVTQFFDMLNREARAMRTEKKQLFFLPPTVFQAVNEERRGSERVWEAGLVTAGLDPQVVNDAEMTTLFMAANSDNSHWFGIVTDFCRDTKEAVVSMVD